MPRAPSKRIATTSLDGMQARYFGRRRVGGHRTAPRLAERPSFTRLKSPGIHQLSVGHTVISRLQAGASGAVTECPPQGRRACVFFAFFLILFLEDGRKSRRRKKVRTGRRRSRASSPKSSDTRPECGGADARETIRTARTQSTTGRKKRRCPARNGGNISARGASDTRK